MKSGKPWVRISAAITAGTLVFGLVGFVGAIGDSASADSSSYMIDSHVIGADQSRPTLLAQRAENGGGNAAAISTVRAAQAHYAQISTTADFAKAIALYNELLQQGATSDGSTTSGPVVALAASHSMCVTIYRWELEAYAWYLIVVGGTVAAVGGFIDFSGVGIPVGAIMNAIGIGTGIGGSALLAWVDSHYPSSRVYCIRW